MIRTGIGGWVYPEWRGGAFYPEGLRQADELNFASRAVGAIEINATFYRRQSADSFRRWAAETPDGFVFALKGSRFVTVRRDLATAGEAIDNFFAQGLGELGAKLGPIQWQLAATKRFVADEIAAFLALLPRELGARALRHALEVGHESFACAAFIDLARAANVAVVWCEGQERVTIADRTADFAYARFEGMRSDCPTGYPPDDLDRLAGLCRAWEAGMVTAGLPYAGDPAASAVCADDVFAFMINGAKERAPFAAQALADRLQHVRGHE